MNMSLRAAFRGILGRRYHRVDPSVSNCAGAPSHAHAWPNCCLPLPAPMYGWWSDGDLC